MRLRRRNFIKSTVTSAVSVLTFGLVRPLVGSDSSEPVLSEFPLARDGSEQIPWDFEKLMLKLTNTLLGRGREDWYISIKERNLPYAAWLQRAFQQFVRIEVEDTAVAKPVWEGLRTVHMYKLGKPETMVPRQDDLVWPEYPAEATPEFIAGYDAGFCAALCRLLWDKPAGAANHYGIRTTSEATVRVALDKWVAHGLITYVIDGTGFAPVGISEEDAPAWLAQHKTVSVTSTGKSNERFGELILKSIG